MQWYKGDAQGVVNCLEGHPHYPIIATSGLDTSVKLWAPMNIARVCIIAIEAALFGRHTDHLLFNNHFHFLHIFSLPSEPTFPNV